MKDKAFVSELNQIERFKNYLGMVMSQCPSVPDYAVSPDGTTNVELMKLRSAQKQGFETALAYFSLGENK